MRRHRPVRPARDAGAGRYACSPSSATSRRDPDRFYGALAADTAAMVTDLWRAGHGDGPAGHTVLDVGGGPGYFASAFTDGGLGLRRRRTGPVGDARRRARPPQRAGHLRPRLRNGAAVRRRQRRRLPVVERRRARCRGPWRLGEEMLRVTRPGGLAMLSYTVWLGPFGGHEMGLTHYLGGARAADRYTRKHGHPTEERLRVVVVRGVRGRRPAPGRPAPARWSPHFPATTRDGRGG